MRNQRLKKNIKCKGKIYSDSSQHLLEVWRDIHEKYSPHIISSGLRESEPSGYHILFTIFQEPKQVE